MKFLKACLLLFVLFIAPVSAEKLALVGGTIYTMTGPPIENGVLLINGDKIEGVGAGLAVPADFERIDIQGKSVFPGLINAMTTLGLNEYGGLVPSTVDTNETSDPVTPQLRVTDAFYLDSRNVPVVRRYGVTGALITPGENNVFSGQSAFVTLGDGRLSDILEKSPVALHINLGEPPRSTWGPRNKMPMTRMGIAALIRQTLLNARQYGEKKEKDASTSPDLALEAILPALRGELPVIMRAQRLDDILTALRLAEEFQLEMILSHGTDAYKVADKLAERKISVLLDPVTNQPDSIETSGAIYENAAKLARAGVRFAITTGGAQQAGRLPFEAGMASAYGLDPMEALRAITLYPAQILGVDDRLGSLEEGKIANVIVAEGLVLQPRSRVTLLILHGRRMDMKTWQEDLFEKYRSH